MLVTNDYALARDNGTKRKQTQNKVCLLFMPESCVRCRQLAYFKLFLKNNIGNCYWVCLLKHGADGCEESDMERTLATSLTTVC